MTKTEEIKLLDKTIERFGLDSYIGPWLQALRRDIVDCIRNDVPIHVSNDLVDSYIQPHKE